MEREREGGRERETNPYFLTPGFPFYLFGSPDKSLETLYAFPKLCLFILRIFYFERSLKLIVSN